MQTDLQPDEAVRMAGEWLANEPSHEGRAIVPELKTRFGITSLQAIDAIRAAQALRRARAI
ncbi:hypothetical protein ACG873_30230 [Mesorhizobium sp. AaZ16]